MPYANTPAMNQHLVSISAEVAPGAHSVILVEQAGWHTTPNLAIPDNISLMELPPRAPELNPVENLWQFMRESWLSDRVFKSCVDIVSHCRHSWNKIIEQPCRIRTIGMREWAHGS